MPTVPGKPVSREEFTAWEERLEDRVLAPLRHTSRRYVIWMSFLLVIFAWGIFAWVYQVRHGLIVTGMRDRISWSMYILTFVFVIGISHAGTLLSAILRVTKARWQLSITRMAEFITVVALMVGALFPLIDLGRPDRVLKLIIYGRWQSPLLWDLMAVTTYLAGSTIYLILPLIPDFARARDRLAADAPRWRRTFFRIASMGWTGTDRQRSALDRAMTVMMIAIIPVAVSVHTVISWIFAMTLRSPFNSTVFGAYFVAGAIYSGVAAIILLMAVLRRVLHLEEYITKTQFLGLGYLLAGMALIMLYFNLSEYVTTGYKMEAGVPFHFHDLMTGYLAPMFWFYIIGGILVPPLIIAMPWTRTIKGIVVAAVLVIVAMWLERYLIVIGGFRVPLMPYDARPYAPSWVEWSIFGGAAAMFMLIISAFAKVFPMVSVWEVVEHRGPESAWAAVPYEGGFQELERQDPMPPFQPAGEGGRS
jgi:molybdopterin-containing oxidoreductase family membrane subunit